MCTTCGCSDGAVATVSGPGIVSAELHSHGNGHGHDHPEGQAHVHPHGHPHEHGHDHGETARDRAREVEARGFRPQRSSRTLRLEEDLLAKNGELAERNRGWLEGRKVVALNLTSSPGSGKTTLLERTIRELGASLPISVIEGDQETLRDAERIRAAGGRAVQINTGSGCHLDAEMIREGLRRLDPPPRSLVMIENVGNLVCPALFDLGERAKVVIVSVTEGEDKPLKYPHMFRASSLMIVNKIDLLPYLTFDVDRLLENARRVNPGLSALQVSATRGDGLEEWYGWLRRQAPAAAAWS